MLLMDKLNEWFDRIISFFSFLEEEQELAGQSSMAGWLGDDSSRSSVLLDGQQASKLLQL